MKAAYQLHERNVFGKDSSDLTAIDLHLNSEDRTEGSPGQYTIVTAPLINNVWQVELKHFNGSLIPYNLYAETTYTIREEITIGAFILRINHNYTIPAGNWNLEDLLNILNDNPAVRFTYIRQTGKVTVEKIQPGVALFGLDAVTNQTPGFSIGALIGFPDGWTMPIGPEDAIQSTFMVATESAPTSILIVFDKIGGQTVTSGKRVAGFTIPLNARTFDNNTNKVNYKQLSDFKQSLDCNQIQLSHLGIRLLNPSTGSPFLQIGEHSMLLTVYHSSSTAS